MKNSKAVFSLLLLGVIGGMSLAASAASADGDKQFVYLGGGLGYGRLDSQDYTNADGNLTNSGVSWKGVAGYHLNRIVAVEGQYIDFGADNRGNDKVKATGWTLGAVLSLPVDGPVTPYAKLGLLNWETRNRFNGISRNQTGSDLGYGLGVRFSLAEDLDLRGEYERFDMDQTKVDSFSAVLQYKFL